MPLISLQPNQTFHGDLVKRVVIRPLCWLVVANLRTAISASPSVVSIAGGTHRGSIAFHQAVGRVTDHHLRAGAGIIQRDVNPQDVLPVVGACHCDIDFRVPRWVDPIHAATEVVLKQAFLVGQPRLLGF